MRVVYIFLLVFGSFSVFSQGYAPEKDAIEDSIILREFYYRTKFQLRLSHERTLLTSGVNIKLNNLKIGFQFKKHYKAGAILFTSKRYRTYDESLPTNFYYETTILGYGAYFEYVIIDNYRYYIGVPLNVSRAYVSRNAHDLNGDRMKHLDYTSDGFGLVSLGATGGLNLNYWFTVSAGLGYRLSYSGSKEENAVLNTPFYSFGLKLRFGNLMTSVFHNKDVKRMKQAYFRNKTSWRANVFRKRHKELYE